VVLLAKQTANAPRIIVHNVSRVLAKSLAVVQRAMRPPRVIVPLVIVCLQRASIADACNLAVRTTIVCPTPMMVVRSVLEVSV